MDNNKYFAAEEDAKETVAFLQKKAKYWFESLTSNSYLDKIRKNWDSYYGLYYKESHDVNFGGEHGEIVNLAVNHFRNLAQHMLVMVTGQRPAFQPRSTNTDHKSQIQTYLAHGLLEYYMREKRLERHLKNAVESAIVLGSGFIKMEWNATSGKIYDYIDPEPKFSGDKKPLVDESGDYVLNENDQYVDEDGNPIELLMDENGELIDDSGKKLKPFPIYEGDVSFTNLSPFDVVMDATKESSEDHDWVICRTFKNKYDLAAKFPEFKEEIEKLKPKHELYKYRKYISPIDETSDVPVYEFFHRKTESMPDGRYILYLADDIVLMDTTMPYRRLPIYRIAPSDILGTPYGYTIMFDIYPIQEAVNSLYSTVLTNQNAFGVQNILNPRGNDVKVEQVGGALNFIQYNPQFGKPEALNLTQTPAEIFNFMGILERTMETVSGINSVARGNPEANLRTGNALALVQSQALQFISGLQNAYVQLIEDVGTGLIQLLQDFATVPRIAEIAGKSNKTKIKYFNGEDLNTISRVIVDVGNSLSQTTAGRIEMAANLVQMQIIKTPEEYFSVLNSGRLETMTQGANDELFLIKAENERLVDGSSPVIAVDTDDHALHIKEHKCVLSDPDARLDPELLNRTLAHIQEHIDALRNVNPDLLAIIGQQTLQAPSAPPQAPMGPEQMMSPEQPQNLPNLPEPAQPPVDPNTGQPLVANQRPLGQ